MDGALRQEATRRKIEDRIIKYIKEKNKFIESKIHSYQEQTKTNSTKSRGQHHTTRGLWFWEMIKWN